MLFADIVKAFFALAVTLGVMGLLVVALRRYGPETMKRLQGVRPDRRLEVLETLVLDPARRLVLVRIDAEERLILLGEGRALSTHAAGAAVVSPTTQISTPHGEPAP